MKTASGGTVRARNRGIQRLKWRRKYPSSGMRGLKTFPVGQRNRLFEFRRWVNENADCFPTLLLFHQTPGSSHAGVRRSTHGEHEVTYEPQVRLPDNHLCGVVNFKDSFHGNELDERVRRIRLDVGTLPGLVWTKASRTALERVSLADGGGACVSCVVSLTGPATVT